MHPPHIDGAARRGHHGQVSCHCAREPSRASRGQLACASRTPLRGVQRGAALRNLARTNQPTNQPTTTPINDKDNEAIIKYLKYTLFYLFLKPLT